jgi:hypothetical protein
MSNSTAAASAPASQMALAICSAPALLSPNPPMNDLSGAWT